MLLGSITPIILHPEFIPGLLQLGAWIVVIVLLVQKMDNPYDDDDF